MEQNARFGDIDYLSAEGRMFVIKAQVDSAFFEWGYALGAPSLYTSQ